MKNPIQSYDFFATPENMDALEYNRDQYHGGEKTAFTMGMMLTWNYLSAELDKWIAAQKPELSPAAVEALASYQQADMDGVMVLVSRQAVEECLRALRD